MSRTFSSVASLILLAAPVGLHAQTAVAATTSTFPLTIPSIMRGTEVFGREPQDVRWSPDGQWIYFRWLPPGTDWRETLRPYRVRAAAGAVPEDMSEAAWDSSGALFSNGSASRDGRLRVVSANGDLYLIDMPRNTTRRLTGTREDETNPQLSTDGRWVYFTRGGNAYAIELEGGFVQQLSDIRTGPEPKPDSTLDPQRRALEKQQRTLLEAIRDRVRQDSLTKARRTQRDASWPKTLYLKEKEKIASISVSPNGRAMLLLTEIPATGALDARVPNYVTKSGYTEEIESRRKVGDAQTGGRIAFVRLSDGQVRWLRPVPGDTLHTPAYVRVNGWSDDGTSALVIAQSADFKTRVITTVGADSGATRSVDVLRDTAWVDGPCAQCAGWYDGGRRIWFVSEADGFAHVYTIDARGGDRKQLTRGRWEVVDVALSPDKREFYLHTSETSPYEQHFWRMPVGGGARTCITTRMGGHVVTPSPDGTMLADLFSTSNRPPELFVMRNEPNAPMSQLTTSPTREWLSFPWLDPAIITIPASDGVQVPARIYRPSDMGAQPNGAAVIFVHGAGYLHNVNRYWSYYKREYMFHHLLASKGYVVLDLDYRGSAGYGRDWRTAIYRYMGGRDLQDQVDASRWLQQELKIDPERIGIYGGSYGGFITLMALFTQPKQFGAGAGLRSVTDWAHYDHEYTGEILNTPQSDTLAYRRSSPIYFAEGLEDPLLIAHGMVDTNVHFQDVVRLSERLIELGKTNWELAVFPVEDHSFVRPSSWTDEYRRIYELFERTISRPGLKAAPQ
jgi:dipeptidyl aminopeptidase/acylaminoacyl peptidase